MRTSAPLIASAHTSTPSAAGAALHRPVRLPTISPGDPCPVTLSWHQPDKGLGIVQGTGWAGPVGLSASGVLNYADPTTANALTDRSWGAAKVLWAVDSAIEGPVLVRGGQLDGTHSLRFNDPPVHELLLLPKPPVTPGGWRDYPGFTRVRAPGCYAYQVDAASGSAIIVFLAKGPHLAP